VRGAGEAVVADHAVGDEIAGAGGDVVERHGPAEWLDRHDAELRVRLQRHAHDVALAPDRRVGEVEEPQSRLEAATDPDIHHPALAWGSLDDELEAEPSEAEGRAIDELAIGVGDAQNAARARALGIENAGQEPPAPLVRGCRRPRNRLGDGGNAIAGLGPERANRATRARCRGERELVRRDVHVGEVLAGAAERLEVREREPEAMNVTVPAAGPL